MEHGTYSIGWDCSTNKYVQYTTDYLMLSYKTSLAPKVIVGMRENLLDNSLNIVFM